MSVHDLQLHSESYINFFLSVSGSSTGLILGLAVFAAAVFLGAMYSITRKRKKDMFK